MSQDQEVCLPSPNPLRMLDEEHTQKGKEAELSSVLQVLIVGQGSLRIELCSSPIKWEETLSPASDSP